MQEEEKVWVYIEPRPGGGALEGGINGKFFRLETGKRMLVPKRIAALIQSREAVHVESEARVKAFSEARGPVAAPVPRAEETAGAAARDADGNGAPSETYALRVDERRYAHSMQKGAKRGAKGR